MNYTSEAGKAPGKALKFKHLIYLKFSNCSFVLDMIISLFLLLLLLFNTVHSSRYDFQQRNCQIAMPLFVEGGGRFHL